MAAPEPFASPRRVPHLVAPIALAAALALSCRFSPAQSADETPKKDESPRAVKKMERIQNLDEAELLTEALQARQVNLDLWEADDKRMGKNQSQRLVELADEAAKKGGFYPGPAVFYQSRVPHQLDGLPLQVGLTTQLDREPAQTLHAQSRKLRDCLAKATEPGDPRVKRDAFKDELARSREEWTKPAAIPVILQMLQGESVDVRMEMIDLLGRIDGSRATRALATRALVDFSPEVRAAAVSRLVETKRPLAEYRDIFLAGLRYPWVAVQKHAAEAIVAVDDKALVGQMVDLLDERPPTLHATIKAGNKDVTFVREVVRVNHLKNCLMCHPPSHSRNDLVRGSVPTPNRALGSVAEYYEGAGQFVRADTTYLRQDFSVVQREPATYKHWPSHQRYDYLVRTRLLTAEQKKEADKLEKGIAKEALREPVLFALRKLTGADHGTEPGLWREKLGEKAKPVAIERPAKTDDWRQFIDYPKVTK